jgi:hypothetical protein
LKTFVCTRLWLGLALSAALPAWSQVAPSAAGGSNPGDDDARMMTPPPVSGQGYPNVVGSEMRTNYLSGAIYFTGAYNDNVYPGGTSQPIADFSYSVFPTIAFQMTRPRQSETFRYSPGFTLYQRNNGLNQITQSAQAAFQYRLSPHTTFTLNDEFNQNSNAFTQPNLAGVAVSGSTQNSVTGIIAPYAESLMNKVQGSVTYQFSAKGMIGGGGSFDILNYPNPQQVVGLYNFKTSSGSAFYNLRLSSSQYIGGNYQYARSDTSSPITTVSTGSTSLINGISLFYSHYFGRTLSFSLSGGAQHVDQSFSVAPATTSWRPQGMGSIGWQTERFNLAAGFSRSVSAGNGFNGAFNSTNANVSMSWRMSRIWSARFGGAYMLTESVTPQVVSSMADGHSIFGDFSVERRIGEHFTASVGYTRLHQRYARIAAISSTPDANREYVSVSYNFTRPLGR